MSSKLNENTIKQLAEKQKYSLIDSFCGCGGLGLGLSWAGFESLLAFDNNARSIETHNGHLNKKAIVADVRELSHKDIFKMTDLKKGKLDLFAGGPPCQGFSKQKRGAHLGDTRNSLVYEYIRLVKELKPRFFLFENVAIFGQKRGQKYIDEMCEQLTNYELHPNFFNSADYGLAQTRERFILVGQRKDQKNKFRMPKPTVKDHVTVGDVLKGLPEPPEDYSVHPEFYNHQAARVTPINIHRFSFVPQGGGWQNIPKELRLKCHQNVDPSKGGWPDVYGRLEWNGQCPTITGGFDSFTRGRYGHPLYNRPITPREAARLQGFPDDMKFEGNRGDVRLQIGNAVPPPLAHAVGIEIIKCLLKEDGILEKIDELSVDEYKVA